MDTLNRSAIVVKPKQRFLDWLHAADPTIRGITLSDVTGEPTIYLIPECDTNEDVVDALREVCEEIFEEQLDGWYRVPSSWPQDRSYEEFCLWFDYQHHSMLIDLGEEPLTRGSGNSIPIRAWCTFILTIYFWRTTGHARGDDVQSSSHPCFSLIAQRRHRIEARRAECRNIRGDQPSDSDYQTHKK